ncbi:MAG: NAD(P)/FAD-dependent oxidoreductase [Halieaceae bacterium]
MTDQADHDQNSSPLDALVVGAGFNGVFQLYQLRKRGFKVKVVDAGAELGGVWYANCYPGARVDSHVPNYEFSFDELWKDWSWAEKFPGREELRGYFDYLEEKLDLKKDIEFNTWVTAARFDESRNLWRIETDNANFIEARHFILCTGFAAKAHTPAFKGIDTFEGACYHSGHWPQQGLDLKDRRVGIIGTGASGVQIAQEASKVCSHLTVFQRTPIMALPMRQQKMGASEHLEKQANYPEQHRRARVEHRNYFDIAQSRNYGLKLSHEEQQAIMENAWAKGGFHFWGNIFADVLSNPEVNRLAYDFWRDKTRERIEDPAIAEILAPTDAPHPFGTKRPSLEQWYYEIFNQDNVTLVDTQKTSITEITKSGVRTEETEYPLDILVMATGFDAFTGGLTQFDITGVGGKTLKDKWNDGVQNFLGIGVADFPNMFILYGPLSPSGLCNGPVCAELQGEWIVNCLSYLRDNNYHRIEATQQAEENWRQHVADFADLTLFPLADSWYMGANIPGKTRQFLNYPQLASYVAACQQSAEQGYEGFDLSP